MYPAEAPETGLRVGPYELQVAPGAPVAEGSHPLVAISHGSKSTPLVQRTLAMHLARNGFVVVVPEHERDNRNDSSAFGTAALLGERPRQLRRAIDWAFADDALAARLRPDVVGVVGHSMGGYTGLALAGGRPTAFANETPDGTAPAIEVEPEPRMRALVLLAPATPWYLAPGALRDVRVPILMLTGQRDTLAPAWMADLVTAGVPEPSAVRHHVVPNAGHFAFLSPFPPAMVRPDFPPSQDPPGFDRAAFHAELYDRVTAFLRATLAVADGALDDVVQPDRPSGVRADDPLPVDSERNRAHYL